MSRHEHDNTPDMLPPEPGLNAEHAADELAVHGLLEFERAGDALRRDVRIAEAMNAIRNGAMSRRDGRAWKITRWSLAAAAGLALVVMLARIGMPGETSALASVERSIVAMRQVRDHRYEVRVESWKPGDLGAVEATDDRELPTRPVKNDADIVDMRLGGLLVIQHRAPHWKHSVFVGIDGTGKWSIRGGQVNRERPERDWPPWATIQGQSMFTDSVDGLLSALTNQYDLIKPEAAANPASADGAKFDRITATRRLRTGHEPHRVELWLDPTTRLVDRIEFQWDWEDRSVADPTGQEEAPGNTPARARPLTDRDHEGASTPPTSVQGDGANPRDGGRGGNRPGYPKLITFQRVQTPQFADDWFDAAAHADGATGDR